jgi:hypothetical protein
MDSRRTAFFVLLVDSLNAFCVLMDSICCERLGFCEWRMCTPGTGRDDTTHGRYGEGAR